MDKHEVSQIIEKHLCSEIDTIAESISKTKTMSTADLEKLEKLYRTLKAKATYEAMVEATEYEEGISGRRGRGADGRYVSRDSYAEGFDRGYSEAMNKMNDYGVSGHHYPPMPYPSDIKRW